MKKTRMILSNLSDINYNIESLEESGWEVVNFKDINLSNGEVWILLMAQKETDTQKEEDKSVYEKIYLLEKYCATKGGCKGCEIENICHGKYERIGAAYWDFEDVKKAYEVIRDGDR